MGPPFVAASVARGSRFKMCLSCGDLPPDLCLQAERAAMTELSVSEGKLNVDVKGWDKV